ncbi:hypothetical protein BGX27_003580 [Mortierella sp. AM989]|nr:hypothetical protein BGX27_003580 [Mortierella sp. AM989]
MINRPVTLAGGKKSNATPSIHSALTAKLSTTNVSTYNDPTKKRGPPKGKLVPMMTGYIEAIEARLHRMEGLLGGLVKDKDPRAEIVRAELDAMAREAEMTGLKLRRSKAYEEINHAMTNATNGASNGSGPAPSAISSRPQNQNIPQQQQQRLVQSSSHILPNHSVSQTAPGYRTNSNAPIHTENVSSQVSSPSRSQPLLQPLLQPTPISPASRSNQYQPYEPARHPPSHKSHQLPQHVIQHHHHQSPVVTSPSYLKQSQPHLSQPPQPPQQQQQQHHHQPHYIPTLGDAGFASPSQQANYSDNRGHSTHYRQGSHAVQPHYQAQSPHEGDYHQTSNGFSSNNHYTADRHQRYGNSGETHSIGSRRMVTHRPSLTAHQLSNPLTGYMHIPNILTMDESLILPSIEVIDHLMDVYFRSIHPVFPMLHPRSITDQLHQNESPPFHLLFAIMGLASRFSDNIAFRTPQPDIGRPPSAIFYERARHFIKDEYDRSQIATVQTLLLMAVQQIGFCENQSAWLYVGMAIRMAQDLGLNKKPSDQEQSRNKLQCELRKRTWWSIYVVERLVCAGLGRPLTIAYKDCEVGFPSCEDEEDDSINGKSQAVRPAIISDFVQLITLSKIQGSILEFVRAKFMPSSKSNNSQDFSSDSHGMNFEQEHKMDPSAAMFTALDKSLAEWRQNLPESLQNPTGQSPHFHLLLHLTFNMLVILLHRPEVPNSQTSASLCAQAAATISDIIEILMEAKALTSMFVSCIYAIFSAGVVHFMNIPSVRRPGSSTTSSPALPEFHETLSSHAQTAKTSLKRCIDALKFLASHWISAARRAKVLEDLLDLKHVSLKDLEVDTFKTSPVGPSWAMEEAQYKEALVRPGKSQDKLRQQCRSKVMAIHSLLANDDEFTKMHRQSSFIFPDHDVDNSAESIKGTLEKDPLAETNEDNRQDTVMHPSKSSRDDSVISTSPISSQTPIGLGVQSPYSPDSSEASPVSVLTDLSSAQKRPLASDPGMLFSAASLGIMDSPAEGGGKPFTKAEGSINAASELVHSGNDILAPIAMTTMVHGGTSPLLTNSNKANIQNGLADGKSGAVVNGTPKPLQEAMLDPFSMPSSISFPDWNQSRQSSNSNTDIDMGDIAGQVGSQLNSAWSTVSQPSCALSVTLSPPTLSNGSKQFGQSTDTAAATFQPLSLFSESSARPFSDAKAMGREEQDLVWNDMPPTLGLDEWTAYIGAMMMRWLYASGQSPPGSTPP